MPIPFILTGLGVAAGILGAGGHLSAMETNEKAEKISQDAQNMFDAAKASLEQAKSHTEEELEKLGFEKKKVLYTSMDQFIKSYEKIKHIDEINFDGTNEISKFALDKQDVIEIQELMSIYESTLKSATAGVATGAVVALAANGSLATVMAEGIGATVTGVLSTPLSAIIAPVLLFTGFSASMKADENLEKAKVMYADAEKKVEEMKISETLCNGISEKTQMFNDLLKNLDSMFAECAEIVESIVKKRAKDLSRREKNKLKMSQIFSREEVEMIHLTRSLAGAVKAVIVTPILGEDGSISPDVEQKYTETLEGLPQLQQTYIRVKDVDYGIKNVSRKDKKRISKSKSKSKNSVLSNAGRVVVFLIAVLVANFMANIVAVKISFAGDKYLWMDAMLINKIAVWVVVWALTMVVIGNPKGTLIGIAQFTTTVALGILYAAYCRNMLTFSHPIIISIILFIILSKICTALEDSSGEDTRAGYFCDFFKSLILYPVFFGIYMIFGIFLGLSEGFWMNLTSVLVLIGAMGNYAEQRL